MKTNSFNLLKIIFGLVVIFFILCAASGKGDFKRAVKLHNSAAERMAKFGDTDAGVLELYTQAIEEYKKCITVNNKETGEAYNYLGRILFTGPRSLRDYPEAVQYLYQAVQIYEREKKSGLFIPHCYNEIGTVSYRLGDFYSAYNNWKKASGLSPQFAGDEAQIYWLGLGVESDLPKAMELYKKAALNGRDLWSNIYALDYQINEYKKGNFDDDGMYAFLDYVNVLSMGEPRDVVMSILKQAADLGWPPAQLDYWMYCRDNNEAGKGMPYLQKAVAANYVPAFFHMGYVYHAGLNNTRVDLMEAKKWYEKAAVQGFPIAQNNLGGLYFQNDISSDKGVSNKEMANYWWNIAAEQGFALAIQNKALVESYRPPVGSLEATLQILSDVATIISNSTRTYNSLNRSRILGYVPPSGMQNTAQNNFPTASTSSSSSGDRKTDKQCPSCNGTRKCNYSYSFGLDYCNGGYLDCSSCRGTGRSNNKVCSSCNGTRKVKCGICHGSGICSRCNGAGRI